MDYLQIGLQSLVARLWAFAFAGPITLFLCLLPSSQVRVNQSMLQSDSPPLKLVSKHYHPTRRRVLQASASQQG